MKSTVPYLFIPVLLFSVTTAQVAAPIPSSAPPSAPLRQSFIVPQSLISMEAMGLVYVYTKDKRLGISWSYEDDGRKFYEESFDLSYWPTAAARISDSRLTTGGSILVAGKRPSLGKTIIERWDFSHTVAPSQASPSPHTRTVIFDQSTEGKRGVRFMGPVNGLPGKAFVHFNDSRSMYLINAQTGALTLLATPSQVPKLSSDAIQWMVAGRTAGRYFYVYQSDFAVKDEGALILYDDNADGTIEEWVPLTNVAAWETFFSSTSFQEAYTN